MKNTKFNENIFNSIKTLDCIIGKANCKNRKFREAISSSFKIGISIKMI